MNNIILAWALFYLNFFFNSFFFIEKEYIEYRKKSTFFKKQVDRIENRKLVLVFQENLAVR